ncbi:major histocompatibility complex class I-related gene protein-like isoform X2 [Ahaetulla prasina]|uniref:major histocompatibility complex class I-related gene protein-like isoform X2 n=1 Tax=Ahaetulla prasina TaxID=499056 RepID=UPI0026492A90|nr:major histocompatibility complex class I-related gene protein-like isoform X2 [Ahaetulla prasina]
MWSWAAVWGLRVWVQKARWLVGDAAATGAPLTPGSHAGELHARGLLRFSVTLLCYFYLQLPEPSQGQPQSFVTGYLDDQPIARFNSLTRKTEPLVPWMEEEEKERFLALEWVFRADLEKLSKLDHRAGGPHTWQVTWGCELKEDGRKGGFLHYGYNGWDFISFDKETLRWVAAQPQAEKVKEKWEEDPKWSESNKSFLEETCIEWLQRYQSYRKEALEKTEPPVAKVSYKLVDDSLEVLICQVFGFYPKEIQATWTRDGEVCEYETLPRNVAPNSDGTYYVWLSIEIDPKERDCFQCHLEHKGLQEPLVLALKEETGWQVPVGIGAIIISGAAVLFLICWWWRCWKNLHQEKETYSGNIPPEMVPSPSSTEDEIQTKRDSSSFAARKSRLGEHRSGTHRRRDLANHGFLPSAILSSLGFISRQCKVDTVALGVLCPCSSAPPIFTDALCCKGRK